MLSAKTMQAVRAHAEQDYPRECCGIITGSGATQYVHRCKNRQDELHARDPETHPRTSREAYAIDRADMERIFRDAMQQGQGVLAFYHSHIDCGAYFSLMDKEVQIVFGEPEFPDALHVVLAVYAGTVQDCKGFVWNREKQDFTAAKLE